MTPSLREMEAKIRGPKVQAAKAAEPRQHYLLVTGEVLFQMEEDAPLSTVRLNAVVMSPDGRISLHQIGRTHQAIQMQFHKRLDGVEVKVIDVVIMNITDLGVFTTEEFEAAPEGLELKPQGHA